MRLLNLKIKNFLSIVKADIAFNKFKDGVFIISGATGSGKSSIFDAIHFALYGVPCNHNRNVNRKSLISTYAKKDEGAEVELAFQQGDSVYRINRCLFIGGSSVCKFWNANGEVLTKVREVDNAIVDIIGLTAHQFDQMVMLEQNNFSKFLLADSAERGALLRNVFDTQLFQWIQDYFKTKVTEFKSKADTITVKEQTLLDGSTLEQLYEELDEKVASQKSVTEAMDHLKEQLVAYQEQLPARIAYEKELLDYQNAQAQLKELHKQDEDVARYKRMIAVTDEYREVRDEVNRVRSLESHIAKADIELGEITVQLSELPLSTPRSVSELVEARQNVDRCNAALIAYRNWLQAREQESSLKQRVNELSSYDSKTGELQVAVRDARALLSSMESLSNQWSYYNSYVATWERLSAEIQEKTKEMSAKKLSLMAEAVEFVRKNAEDICPVCNRPLDIHFSSTMPADLDFSDYHELKTQVSILQDRLGRLTAVPEPETPCPTPGQLLEQRTLIEGLERELSDSEFKDKSNSETYAIAMEEMKTASARVELCREEASKYVTVGDVKSEDTIETLQRKAEIASAKLVQLQNAQAEAEEVQKKRQALAQKKNLLELTIRKDKQAVQDIMSSPVYEKAEGFLQNEADITEFLPFYQSAVTAINSYQARLHMLEAIAKPTTDVQITAAELNLKINGMTASISEYAGQIASFDADVGRLERTIQEVDKLQSERKAMQKDFEVYTYLKECLNGENKSKVSLEHFVLHRQLEWILQNSNRFLSELTNGQYQLKLSWEGMSARKQGGLELSVLDTTNGSVRPSHTFSGGELFLLSLSLSIGLMVSINAVFSSVNLDILFIDEGFGTLDNATLNRVLSLIHSLQSVQSIGIISHVQDLIETIPQGLRVEKTLMGSKITQFGC